MRAAHSAQRTAHRNTPTTAPAVSVVLLAAGYGTRLYPLTKHRPKALLSVGHGVILDAIMDNVQSIPNRSLVVLVTNHVFLNALKRWRQARGIRGLEIVDDGSVSPETRLGAMRDLWLAMERLPAGEDVVVVGTDNLFNWSLRAFVAFAQTKRPAVSVAVRKLPSTREAKLYGVVELNRAQRVTRLLEKPARPPSTIIALCVYYLPAASRDRIRIFLDEGGTGDAPGYWLEWVVKREPVYGFLTEGEWFDVGSHAVYQQAVRRWRALQQ